MDEGKSKFIPVHAVKVFWRNRGIAPLILNLDSSLGKWSASRPGRFTP